MQGRSFCIIHDMVFILRLKLYMVFILRLALLFQDCTFETLKLYYGQAQ